MFLYRRPGSKKYDGVIVIDLEEMMIYYFNAVNDFNFNSFLSLNDARQTALAFAKCYERCSSFSYYTRQENAIKAYNYFVD